MSIFERGYVAAYEPHRLGHVFKLRCGSVTYPYACFVAAGRQTLAAIGFERLANLICACGLTICDDTDELLGKWLWVRLAERSDGDFTVVGVKPLESTD